MRNLEVSAFSMVVGSGIIEKDCDGAYMQMLIIIPPQIPKYLRGKVSKATITAKSPETTAIKNETERIAHKILKLLQDDEG